VANTLPQQTTRIKRIYRTKNQDRVLFLAVVFGITVEVANDDTSLAECMPHIPTLYQLSYQESTLRYGLFREEIQDLIDKPDRRVPTHHQVDPRVIEAHLGISTAPTFHIGSQEYSLISRYYHEYFLNWIAEVEANNQSIQ
jgi:hypothetical protein